MFIFISNGSYYLRWSDATPARGHRALVDPGRAQKKDLAQSGDERKEDRPFNSHHSRALSTLKNGQIFTIRQVLDTSDTLVLMTIIVGTYHPWNVINISESDLNELVQNPESAKQFLKHAATCLVRVYPKGIRFDSSNYNPSKYWPFGAQILAL